MAGRCSEIKKKQEKVKLKKLKKKENEDEINRTNQSADDPNMVSPPCVPRSVYLSLYWQFKYYPTDLDILDGLDDECLYYLTFLPSIQFEK